MNNLICPPTSIFETEALDFATPAITTPYFIWYILLNLVFEYKEKLRKDIDMEPTDSETNDFALVSFIKLIQVINSNPEIKDRVEQLLKMESFRRRNVLNNWLEQLRKIHAPEKLTNTLSYLFDDIIATKTRNLLNQSNNT